VLQWLWVMTNTMVAFFMIHPYDAAGWFARRLERELACRWLFLEKKALPPPTTARNESCASACCGESAPRVPPAKKATAG
jgi:hypothetical protein